jgi:sulfatase maturation enzyme AslB (radical SAM superfamily)
MPLNQLQLLSLEVGDACNLAHAHRYCPVNRPERHKGGEPWTDDQGIDFLRAALWRGFRGLLAFHYYNEPLLSLDRLFALQLRAQELGVGSAIWTNGTLLDDLAHDWIGRFARVFVTDHDPRRRGWLREFQAKHPNIVAIKAGGHDCRGQVYESRAALRPKPCWRPTVTEIPVDFCGQVHLCCIDWRGDTPIGNIRTDPHEEILDRWEQLAAAAVRGEIDICRRCQRLPRTCMIHSQDHRL